MDDPSIKIDKFIKHITNTCTKEQCPNIVKLVLTLLLFYNRNSYEPVSLHFQTSFSSLFTWCFPLFSQKYTKRISFKFFSMINFFKFSRNLIMSIYFWFLIFISNIGQNSKIMSFSFIFKEWHLFSYH